LNERLLKLGPARIDEIRTRWSEGASRTADRTPTLNLSADERAYLRSLPPLALGVDTSWAPFTYLDSSGQPSGVALAYAAYLSKALDIDFDRRVYPDWADVSSAFASGHIDMVATTKRETPRLAGGIATEPVERFPLVVVGRPGEPVMNGMGDVSSRRVVVTARLAASGRAGNLAPNAVLSVAPNLTAALDRVVRGDADLFVGDLVAVDIALGARYEDQLKIIGSAGEFEQIGFVLRPEFRRLVPLIDRALRAMRRRQTAYPRGASSRVRSTVKRLERQRHAIAARADRDRRDPGSHAARVRSPSARDGTARRDRAASRDATQLPANDDGSRPVSAGREGSGESLHSGESRV
jgi:ABC-type amino acid transport substrate-binding protein